MSEEAPAASLPVDRFPRFAGDLATGAQSRSAVGGREAIGVSDGFFDLDGSADFLQSPGDPTAGRDLLRAELGTPVLPVGSFLIPGEPTVLIDAGLGPTDYGDRGALVGGNLLRALAAIGVGPADVDVLALTHLHVDHVGWIADGEGDAVFPDATVAVAREDWAYFVEGRNPQQQVAPDVLSVLGGLAEEGRVTLLGDGDQAAPGLRRIAAPGHTPGHSAFELADGDERLLFLGDAFYCPQQFAHDWTAKSEVDRDLARHSREALIGELGIAGTSGVGNHFPYLEAGRLIEGEWQTSRSATT